MAPDQPPAGASDAAAAPAPGVAPTAPAWVHAAALHRTLQASGAVPHLHAAGERDRRLANATALVRQQLALGATPAQIKQRVMERFAAAASAREQDELRGQMEALVGLTQQLAAQNASLAAALERQGAEMTEQRTVSGEGERLGQLPYYSYASSRKHFPFAAFTVHQSVAFDMPFINAALSLW